MQIGIPTFVVALFCSNRTRFLKIFHVVFLGERKEFISLYSFHDFVYWFDDFYKGSCYKLYICLVDSWSCVLWKEFGYLYYLYLGGYINWNLPSSFKSSIFFVFASLKVSIKYFSGMHRVYHSVVFLLLAFKCLNVKHSSAPFYWIVPYIICVIVTFHMKQVSDSSFIFSRHILFSVNITVFYNNNSVKLSYFFIPSSGIPHKYHRLFVKWMAFFCTHLMPFCPFLYSCMLCIMITTLSFMCSSIPFNIHL